MEKRVEKRLPEHANQVLPDLWDPYPRARVDVRVDTLFKQREDALSEQRVDAVAKQRVDALDMRVLFGLDMKEASSRKHTLRVVTQCVGECLPPLVTECVRARLPALATEIVGLGSEERLEDRPHPSRKGKPAPPRGAWSVRLAFRGVQGSHCPAV